MAGFWIGFLVGIGIMVSIFAFGIYRFKKMTQANTEQAMAILTNQMGNIKVPDDTKEEGTKEEGTKEE